MLFSFNFLDSSLKDDIESKVFIPLAVRYPETEICIQEAKEVGKNRTTDPDKSFAVALINLYTQNCPIGNKFFHKELNTQLGEGHPEQFWQTVGNMIDRAIDEFDIEYHTVSYRGQGFLSGSGTPVKGQTYSFKSVLSTSLLPMEAQEFYCTKLNKYFFEVHNVKGLYIANYSDYKGEEEVVIKTTASFTVSYCQLV